MILALRRLLPQEPGRERLLAFARFVWNRFIEDHCFETAGALAYGSVFASVPLLAAVFGIVAVFPAFDQWSAQLTHFLFSNFVPQAARAVEEYLRQFADNSTRLTSAGLVALMASALFMMKSIEDTFDRIWRVSVPRPGLARFLVYWTALTLGPLLAVASLALSSYLVALPVFSEVGWMPRLLPLLPLLLELIAFTLAYVLIPNTAVALRNALVGGVLATILFELARWGLSWYLQRVPSYEQIYGTLAVIPIFLVWVYLCWVAILLGASIAASLSAFRFLPQSARVPPGQELYVVLRILGRFSAAQREGHALSLDDLRACEPGVDDDALGALIDRLGRARILVRAERGGWLLSRDLDSLSLLDLYEAVDARLPMRAVNLPGVHDSLGRPAAAALAHLQAQLKASMALPVSRLLGDTAAAKSAEGPQ